MLNNNLRQYLIGLMKQLKTKITLRTYYYDKLIHKELILNEIYDNIDNKRTKQAKHTKRQLNTLINKIEKQNYMFRRLIKQRFELFQFYTNVFSRIRITEISDLIYNVLTNQIKFYYSKTLVRYVNTQRSKVELIKLGINNMTYDASYQFNEITYLKDNQKIEFHYKDKFDELLDYTTSNKEITRLSEETCIPIKSLLKICVKMNFIYDDPELRNDLIDNMFNATKGYQNIESNILNT